MTALAPSLVSDALEMPPVPFGIVASLETFESACEGLRLHHLTCVLKVRGQRSGSAVGLYGDRKQVMAFARRCRREQGFTFVTNLKGLL